MNKFIASFREVGKGVFPIRGKQYWPCDTIEEVIAESERLKHERGCDVEALCCGVVEYSTQGRFIIRPPSVSTYGGHIGREAQYRGTSGYNHW